MGNLWKSLLVVSLIVIACTSISIDERLKLATECNENCQQLWDDWNFAVERKMRRDAAKNSPCARGYILYCDIWCSRATSEGVCVRASSIRY